jgi:hypothetical protein
MKTLRYVISATMLLGAHAALAQAPTAANLMPPAGGKNQSSNGEVTIAKKTLPCEHIITECKKLGFIAGQYKADNGLWKDCFNPVVKGGSPTRDGAAITVPVSASDVQACKAAVFPNGASPAGS